MADFNYTKRKIDEDEDISNNADSKTSFASNLRKKLAEKKIDDALEIINFVLSFTMACTYAIETYYESIESIVSLIPETPILIEIIEIILILLMICDWLLFLVIHPENRILYVFSFDSMITYITVIPTAMIRFHSVED
jgi:hypothetical protein